MKRTNLIVDEDLLREAKRLLGAESFSAAVNAALQELINTRRVRGLTDFFGSGVWQGDLTKMREDKPKVRPKRRPA